MIKTQGLSHIHLLVKDLDRSVTFYKEVFGMEELFREGPHMVFLRTHGQDDMITLHEASDGAVGQMGSIEHFGFMLAEGSDYDAAIADIERAGGRLLKRGNHGPDTPYAYIADPDGYVIEV
jgi:catechol 2,3-dioxygenase-like lactoylglutathione lyase family enzyme